MFQWFLDKEEDYRDKWLIENGLKVDDKTKYDRYVVRATWSNIIYSGVLLLIALIYILKVIFRW